MQRNLRGSLPGASWAVLLLWLAVASACEPVNIGSRVELFVDSFMIEKLEGLRLELQKPRDEGPVLHFDRPWEGRFCGYTTIIRDGDLFRAYYRGSPKAGRDGNAGECCCCAESHDGRVWTKPNLGLFTMDGTKENNVVLANASPVTHNFCPFLDSRPGVDASSRFKAIGGTVESGLVAYRSADGVRWFKMRDEPIMHRGNVPFPSMFDSQNLAFWSLAEKKYVCFFRVFKGGIRRIARSDSMDFFHWSPPVLMEYRGSDAQVPIEHLYTNQTNPYFRAPHIYVAVAARFMPRRQVLTEAQAQAIQVDPGYFKDTSDAVFMTTRPSDGADRVGFYDRTFLEGFVRGGIGARNWVSRTNYPALNVIQTGPTELSFYVNQDYAQPTAHLRRYSLRLDGFASAHADYRGGYLLTRPFIYSGRSLWANFATSAAGGIRYELQGLDGRPLPGMSLGDCVEQIGNEIERIVAWKGGDVAKFSGVPVRMKIAMADADLYSFQFR